VNTLSHLKAAFDDSFTAQLVTSPEGAVLAANYQATQLLGEEILHQHHKDLIIDDAPDLEGLAAKFETHNLQNWQNEYRYTRKDNVVIWARINVSAIRHDEKVLALLIQLQDITGQKRTEDDLLKNSEDLEQFVFIASHDLREPLTAVAGYATLLKKRYADALDDLGKHFLEEVIDSTKRMERKIDDLLAFSRAGRSTPQGSFQLGVAIEEARRSVSRSIEESGVVFSIPEDLPMVSGDRSMVAQIFQNLFSNSIKYRSPDRPLVISVDVNPHDDAFLCIAVSDNGLGFDMQFKERIFGVFQRLYTTEQYPGTGIGLAIAKRIVERHRGEIWTQSEPDKGATFYFTLPNVSQT